MIPPTRGAIGASRRLPVGLEMVDERAAHVRLWAPRRRSVEVVREDGDGTILRAIALDREADGYWSGVIDDVSPGDLYRYRLDGGERFPDPASRFQPYGPHGPSSIVDPAAFEWTDDAWQGPAFRGAVLYEMHVGTFTMEGTWDAAASRLHSLADLGITVIELMPVADWPGRFGWGYDGVNLFAPTQLYGTPDDFRRFVDRAHRLELGVILDVVYNHLGPDGNYLPQFSPFYVSERHTTDWGPALNFDGDESGPVRELVLANAAYWIDEFHLDGLRLDATQNIYDDSQSHIVADICARVSEVAGARRSVVVAENEPQDVRLLWAPDEGGFGVNALWNDDWHHTAMVALTGRNEAYYSDYRGTPQELVSAAKHGFLYQGQYYSWQKKARGTPTRGLDPSRFIHFLQNHDQLANSAFGTRGHSLAAPGRWRAMTSLLLLGPQTPMLFQGQELDASSPFLYFADHVPELASKVRGGRTEFLVQFPSLAAPNVRALLADPADPETFERCKLDHAQRTTHAPSWLLHRDLIALRRNDATLGQQGEGGIDGAVLSATAFVLRFFDTGDDDRLLIVNLGSAFVLDVAPEPLLAPPMSSRWELIWSSEDPRYGGAGTPPLDTDGVWRLPAEAAVLLAARRGARS
jgi:maltooligosyltrehalose trehalohydrolase